MNRGQEVYTATIWPSGKNVAVISILFLLDASQVEERKEKVFELLE